MAYVACMMDLKKISLDFWGVGGWPYLLSVSLLQFNPETRRQAMGCQAPASLSLVGSCGLLFYLPSTHSPVFLRWLSSQDTTIFWERPSSWLQRHLPLSRTIHQCGDGLQPASPLSFLATHFSSAWGQDAPPLKWELSCSPSELTSFHIAALWISAFAETHWGQYGGHLLWRCRRKSWLWGETRGQQ